MTYIGEIHNGVVVLKDAPPLEDGTMVRVEVEPGPSGFRPGSPEAVLFAIKNLGGSWAESATEMDEALDYLRREKLEEVRVQEASPEPEL